MKKIFKKIGILFLVGTLSFPAVRAEDFCTVYPQYLQPGEWENIGGTAAPNYYNPHFKLMTGWAYKFPQINNDGTWRYGGLPQNWNSLVDPGNPASLTFLENHLAQLEYAITHPEFGILDPNQRGVASLDWEGFAGSDSAGWWLSWDITNTRYHTASKDLVLQQHPTWTDPVQIEAEAKRQFEEAAMHYFIESLNKAKALRPNVRWGFYYYPYRRYWCSSCPGGVGYPSGTSELNNNLIRLWQWYQNNNGAIIPSIYQFYPSATEGIRQQNETYIRSNIQEAQRISQQYGNLPIYPFVWGLYHDAGPAPKEPLLEIDLRQMIQFPFEEGANGLLHLNYGYNEEENNFLQYADHYENFVSPILSDIMRDVCATQYTVVADATEGGRTDPTGSHSFEIASNVTYAIIPDNGFEIEDVRVDGDSVGAVEAYTFENLRENHALTAQFTEAAAAGGGVPGFDPFENIFNPVMGPVQINYTLGMDSHTKLTIYSRRGEVLRKLVNESQTAGTHSVEWDGKNSDGVMVASGICLLKLDSGGQTHNSKIVVIK